MALENDVTASNVQSTANDPGDVQASAVPVGEAPRGGRGGFQGGQQRGSRGARRNGRGRGNQGNHNNQRRRTPSTVENRPAPPLPPPPGLGGGGSFGSRLTKDAETNEGEGGELVKEQDSQEENVEAETEADYVIFTDDAGKRYEDFEESDFGMIDDTLGVKYDNKEIHSDTLLLLRYNCPDPSCDIACYGWPDLHRHVKGQHQKVMCDLCTRNKKVFTHEHALFSQQELRKHEKFGDDTPGAVDQSGFKGHPDCGFCRQRFYGDDELFAHCRDKHEKCHVCERREQGRQLHYYLDYNALEQHYREDHFLCADQECLDRKFVVFDSEMDLKAHQLEVHPNGLSKDARRDARRIDISTFDYRTPHQDVRGFRGGHEGRGRGRGRDPNTEALPHSTAQPLRRDELAYQRQMAIQSAQSVTARTFGGQLTSTDAYAASPSRTQQEPRTVTAPRGPPIASVPPTANLQLDTNPHPDSQETPQELARRQQHASVTDRASALLKNDQTKVSTFRNTVSSYRTSAITASQLVDTFFSLFDAPTGDVGKLIKELAEIYENEVKRNDLLKAWNDWRAINEDYPTLPGPSGVLSGSSAAAAGSGGHRVLRLKNSTAQSSRSAVSRQGSWGNATTTSSHSPSIPAASASLNRAGAGRVGATPWTAPSAVPTTRATPIPARPISRAPQQAATNDSSAFPALPAAAKPNTLTAGRTGTVRWNDGRSNNIAENPWVNSMRGSSANLPAENGIQPVGDGELIEPRPNKKKGAKSKKQTLYKFG